MILTTTILACSHRGSNGAPGLSGTKPLVRRIAFHHLRHTAGSLFLMSGVPLEVVQRMLRHTDPKITSGV
jgi:integrase